MQFIVKICLITLSLLSIAHAEVQFLTISDIHYGSKNIAQDGHDTGPEFMKISMEKMKQLSKNIDFILFLGDIPTHTLFFDPEKKNSEQFVFHELHQNNSNAKPMFYISGNNDSLGGNYQAFETNGVTPLTYATDWHGDACVYCKELLIDDTHMHDQGYYSSYVLPDNKEVILIVLNATQWSRVPLLKSAMISKPEHEKENAAKQMSWLAEQLKNNHAKQLLIAMHEPPGVSFTGETIWYREHLEQFIKILTQYKQLYGQITLLTSHTHMEEFRKITLGNGVNVYAYSTPSISRNHHNFPGMKIFSFDNNFKIQNFVTWYTSDLHQWNNQQYSAIGTEDAIFPQCTQQTLSECLDGLSSYQVCDSIDRGLFYGVKNPKVINALCKKSYLIN